ncbi:MAG TPA: hypothetical protein VFT71_04835 [Candidatus Nitrosocosmicus sp.]|nr:hypothetical protein [Candidatus Nitrosocosmicus sp.]
MNTPNMMNSIINTNKALITSTVLAISFILLLGPASMTMNVFATANTANQGIGQSQASTQLGICVSGTGTLVSCNNLNAQNQANTGNNALAQQGGGSGSGANIANQAIGQAQSSTQNSGVVSGGNTAGSGNNLNTQTQTNTGNNAAAQSGGGSGGGNQASQGIGQAQTSNQNSGVVSGGNTAGSGNNLNTQTQTNTGSNAAAQQ